MRIEALLDTNVIVAALADDHNDHRSSVVLLFDGAAPRFAVTAHVFAEAYNTLTRRGGAASFGWTPDRVMNALDTVRARTVLVGLSPEQTYDTVRDYASAGGVGPRVYDKLIGQAAVLHGIPAIISWNVRHMRGLFPELDVRTPDEWGAAGRS